MNIIDTGLSFTNLSKRGSTNRIILHNTGVTVLQSVEVIHNYHKSIGYAGIGYHIYIRKDGSIYKGRPEEMIGAHASGANGDSIGVCFEGNFNVETMSEAQKNAGKEVVAYLKTKWGISKVQGHNEVNNTSCPGSSFPFAEIANVAPGATINPDTDMNHNGDAKDATKRLQIALNNSYKSGVVVDGIYGSQTKNAVSKIMLKNYTANEVVRWAQDRLVYHKGYSLVIDGKYGSQTASVVTQFQRDNKIFVDGKAGLQTISLLI